MVTQLHSKSYLTTQFLARYFLSIDVGDKIKTVSDFLAEFDSSRGTIQNSIEFLRESGAIEFTVHGKMGKVLKAKNIPLLMKYADINFFVGVMPLPYSKMYEGLSTGIIEVMTRNLKIATSLAFMRGALKRIELVKEGRYDFAIVSKFASNEYLKNNPDSIEVAIDFGEESFLKGHILIFADSTKNNIEQGMKVAIDYDSIDQSKLTLRAVGDLEVELVPLTYSQFAERLSDKTIDAAVWNEDEALRSLKEFKKIPCNQELKENTVAVLIVDKKRKELVKILQEAINISEILEIQNQVAIDERLPQY